MRPSPKRLVAAHLTGLLLAASALNWLGPGLPSSHPRKAPSLPDFVASGTRLAPVPIQGVGAREPATWSPRQGEGTLLLVFSEACPDCDRIAPQWRELISSLRPPDSGPMPVDIVLLTTDGSDARGFLARHGLQGTRVIADLATDDDPFARERMSVFASVPQTVLIGPDAIVVRTRVGPLEGDEVLTWITALMDVIETVAAGW